MENISLYGSVTDYKILLDFMCKLKTFKLLSMVTLFKVNNP